MLASNFRFATEDVDVSKLDHPLPDWLATVVHEMRRAKSLARRLVQLTGLRFTSVRLPITPPIIWNSGTFPRDGDAGGTCGFGALGGVFAGAQTEGIPDHGPASG